jgi:hypothetical protein
MLAVMVILLQVAFRSYRAGTELQFFFDAFSSLEPVPTSLENALAQAILPPSSSSM